MLILRLIEKARHCRVINCVVKHKLWIALACIFFFAFSVRLAATIPLYPEFFEEGYVSSENLRLKSSIRFDPGQYHAMGASMAFKHTFISNSTLACGRYDSLSGIELIESRYVQCDYGWPVLMDGRTITAKRVPVYPLFVSLFYKIFGIRQWPVFAVQILLDSSMVILIFLISKKLFGNELSAVLSSCIYTLNLPSIIFTTQLMTDILAGFIFTSFLLAYILTIKSPSNNRFLFLGFIFGLLVLTRVLFLTLLPLLSIGLYAGLPMKKRRRIKGVILMVIMVLMLITPWQYRNYREFGHYSLSNQAGIELYFWNAAKLHSEVEGFRHTISRKVFTKKSGINEIKNPFSQSRMSTILAVDYIRKHPKTYGILIAEGAWELFKATSPKTIRVKLKKSFGPFLSANTLGWDDFYKSFNSAVGKKVSLEYLFFILGVVVSMGNRGQRIFTLTVVLVLIQYFLTLGIIGIVRFKIPIIPVIHVYSGLGVYHLIMWLQRVSYRFLGKNRI